MRVDSQTRLRARLRPDDERLNEHSLVRVSSASVAAGREFQLWA